MGNLYIVRWGPALGDDYSCQVFTAKEPMNAFVELLMTGPVKEGWADLTFEVHYVDAVNFDVVPSMESEDGVYDDASDLIAFGDNQSGVIWRNKTERHQ